ncbi:hypothetical protein DITRI_Ditri09bG0090800 [Diplodiscus trichospermus]
MEISSLTNMIALDLSMNELSGSVPTTIGRLKSLQILDLQDNKLQGSFPLEVCDLKNLFQLRLSANELDGSLPTCLGDLTSLRNLDLHSNKFHSTIPSTFWGLKDILNLDLSSNDLSGSLPFGIGNLKVLVYLNLSRNLLSSGIPSTMESLLYLQVLDLSRNRLGGPIPESLGGLMSLIILNLSNNNLSSVIPKTLERLSNLNYFNVSFNRLEGAIPTGGPFMNFIAGSFFKNYALCGSPRLQVPSCKTGKKTIVHILTDGTNVAIKIFNFQMDGAFRCFDVECQVMRNIIHRNLVKIVTSCSTIDFKALVLEFMPNGSLEKWLYSYNYFLDILQRINIMIDVASALEYLHLGHPIPVIHCDLKPSNVLLDNDLVAHVGDFGIAKLLGEDEFMKQTMTLATIGYMAPEYGSVGIISIKTDVYSYGIMLMEIFTRKKPTDETFSGEMSMRHWVKMSLSNGIIGVADSNLVHKEDRYFDVKANCISSIMVLALECSSELPEDRPDIKDVISMLESIKQRFLNNIENA